MYSSFDCSNKLSGHKPGRHWELVYLQGCILLSHPSGMSVDTRQYSSKKQALLSWYGKLLTSLLLLHLSW